MPTTSAYELAATVIKTVIDTEFEPEGIVAVFDNLHDSLGRYAVDVGIAPEEDSIMSGNALVNETILEVKFFDLWTDEIDPTTVVNPVKITTYAERFRRALKTTKATDPATQQVWYFDVRRIRYPNDPTGNKSRFVATIRCLGNNAGLVETTG
jgi:hypothetical protein